MSVPHVAAIGAILPDMAPTVSAVAPLIPTRPGGFADLLASGIDNVDAKVRSADDLSRRFTLDDSVPVHQVSFALEQARMSLELMLQVRNRLVEGYQQLMNMQL